MAPTPGTAPYPEHWEADVILRDGRICHIRPIRPEDAPALAAFHEGLSAETVYFRFFAPYPRLTEKDLHRFTNVDHIDRVAFIALLGREPIGVGRYDRIDATTAEIAFVIHDDHQGRGLGSILLEHLAVAARERGITRFEAEVLPNNRRMLATFEEAGYRPNRSMDEGVVILTFDINPTESSRAVMQAREQRAEARSIRSLLAPRGVALVGASRREGSIGNTLLHNLRNAGFAGPLMAVHPEAEEILGVPCYPSLLEAPGPIDLAVIAVPADQVMAAIDDCGRAGVRGAVVVSSGFGETGSVEGRQRQRDLASRARANGLRIIGPNALGMINTDPQVLLNASLVPQLPARGRLGFFAQSGAMGVSLLHQAQDRGLGVSVFVSAGNRVDVSANDLLQYWEDDDTTSMVLLYLESIGNPRKFTRVARRLGVRKPIVAVRSGRSSQSIPLGHTVRRTQLPPQAIDAMFDQAGVMQVDTLGELFDVASLLSLQPLPGGRRVAIIGNTDALGVLTADACEAQGLEVAGEPQLIGLGSTVEDLVDAVGAAVSDPDSDAVIVLYAPVLRGKNPQFTEALQRLAATATKPVLGVFMATDESRRVIEVTGPDGLPGPGSIPVFHEVEPAVTALARVVKYALWLQTPRGTVPVLPDVAPDRARAVMQGIREGVAHGDDDALVPIGRPELKALLECYGVHLWDSHVVTSEEQAMASADEVGYPVVLKTVLPELAHRPDLGGVRINLENRAAVRTAYRSLSASLPPEARRMLVLQQQAPAGISVLIEKREDELFGPVVSFGLAGDVPRLLEDRGYRIPPLSDRDVDDLVKAPKAAPLLFGYRGAPAVDIEVLAGLIHRVSQLADDLPELARLELNPVIASGSSISVVGGTAWCGPAGIRADLEARRLPG